MSQNTNRVYRAFSRIDAAACVAVAAVAMCVGLVIAEPTGTTERRLRSLANLRELGVATGQYRNDNADKFPLLWSSGRGRRPGGNTYLGWDTWTFGGKYCSSYWYSFGGGFFDPYPGYRPLNSYVPGAVFPPQTGIVGPNDPIRNERQAKLFRDPADAVGRDRLWPNPNSPAISNYDDVGTSYFSANTWITQFAHGSAGNRTIWTEGTRRWSVGQGIDPARWVVYGDVALETVAYNSWDRQYTFEGNHGQTNSGPSLFYDGHGSMVTYRPGSTRETMITESYQLWFDDIARPENSTHAESSVGEVVR